MHSRNIINRDIKSDNILCQPNGDVKIADMGLSVFLTEQYQYRKTQVGSASWISPEIVLGTSYSKEVDVWAFGCFAFELATGNPPFHERAEELEDLFDAVINDPVERIPDKWSQ